MKPLLNGMVLSVALIAVSSTNAVQAQPENKQADEKGAMKGDRDGQDMMGKGCV
jgi:hypothetical protein